jgi:hypothetical protein
MSGCQLAFSKTAADIEQLLKARVELRQLTPFINGILRLVAKMLVSQCLPQRARSCFCDQTWPHFWGPKTCLREWYFPC